MEACRCKAEWDSEVEEVVEVGGGIMVEGTQDSVLEVEEEEGVEVSFLSSNFGTQRMLMRGR